MLTLNQGGVKAAQKTKNPKCRVIFLATTTKKDIAVVKPAITKHWLIHKKQMLCLIKGKNTQG